MSRPNGLHMHNEALLLCENHTLKRGELYTVSLFFRNHSSRTSVGRMKERDHNNIITIIRSWRFFFSHVVSLNVKL